MRFFPVLTFESILPEEESFRSSLNSILCFFFSLRDENSSLSCEPLDSMLAMQSRRQNISCYSYNTKSQVLCRFSFYTRIVLELIATLTFPHCVYQFVFPFFFLPQTKYAKIVLVPTTLILLEDVSWASINSCNKKLAQFSSCLKKRCLRMNM